jgi:predicted MPP superfamily phosphohydrolase
MKILSIGDVHGFDTWKKFGDIQHLIDVPKSRIYDFDYYVFVGDYVDSFTKTNEEIKNNLKDIIKFKKNHPDRVILLWGNHDIQYLTSYREHGCSGYRPEAYFDLHEIFRKNRKLFQLAFQIDNYIWTHAGIHRGWYEYEFPYKSKNIADDLNAAFEENNKSIYNVGFLRGGRNTVGGPLWADKQEVSHKPIRGYHQIVGHTRIKEMKVVKKDKDTSVTFIDYIEDGGSEPYILEIKKES